jgi:exopolysaccharide production protein ExoZ
MLPVGQTTAPGVAPPAPAAKAAPLVVELQALRFAAAMAVVLFHLAGALQHDHGVKANYFTAGAAGVNVFFVLSGFIMAYTTAPSTAPATFMWRRIARIVPLYWALTLMLAALCLAKPELLNSTRFDIVHILKSLFFIPYVRDDGAVQPFLFLGWSLNYEMLFYAVFAVSLYARKWSPAYPAAIVAVLLVLGRLLPFDNVVWKFYTDERIIQFVYGIGLWYLYVNRREVFATARLPLLAASLAGILAIGNGVVIPHFDLWGLTATAIVALTLGCRLESPRSQQWAALLGGASYSLYLIHPWLIQVFTKKLTSPAWGLAMVPLSLGLLIALSYLSVLIYCHFERPMQGVVLSLRAKPSKQSPAPSKTG